MLYLTASFNILSLVISIISFNVCQASKTEDVIAVNKNKDSKKNVIASEIGLPQPVTALPSLDIARILKECHVMIYIEKEKDKVRNHLEKKAEEFENKLRNLQEKIKLAQSKAETTESELTKMQQNFESEEAESHNKLNTIYKNSEKNFNKAEEEILDIIMEESLKVAQEKNYKFVVNKSMLLICDNNFDITQNVLDAVNKRIQTIPINQHKQ